VALPRGEHLIFLDDVGLPIHGAAPALMRWQVARQSRASLTARLRWASDELLGPFPFPHGEKSVPVSFGYHPYAHTRGGAKRVATVTVGSLEGHSYAQVYAPAGGDFICFEPMTAPTDALVSGDGRACSARGATSRGVPDLDLGAHVIS